MHRLIIGAMVGLILSHGVALADTRSQSEILLVDGAGGQEQHFQRFYFSLKTGYERLKSSGRNVSVAALDGVWRFSVLERETAEALGRTYTPIDLSTDSLPIEFPARTLLDLERAIEKLANNNPKVIYIHFASHGGGGKTFDSPEAAIVHMYNEQIQFSELENMLKKFPHVHFKLSATTCNSGGIHTISKNLPNVCSLSSTFYYLLTIYGAKFERGLWESFVPGKANSLKNMAEHAFDFDTDNKDLGSISSYDYVDSILGTGQYDRERNQIELFPEMAGHRIIHPSSVYKINAPKFVLDPKWNLKQALSALNNQTNSQLKAFLQKATDEQKAKFIQLLQCESESF